jgi:hypothetical protein
MRKRSGPIVVLSLALAILLGSAALPGVAVAHIMAFNPGWLGIFLMVVPSDTLPGTSRTVPFVEDSNLNWGTAPDAWDVYRVHLTAGEVVEISVRGVGDQDIDCLLYDATATSLGTDSIANDLTTGRTSRLTHTVTATGYYSIAVKNADAFNTASYTIAVSVASAGDDLTPGDARPLPLVEQDFVDAVSLGAVNTKPAADQNDFYAVALTAGTPSPRWPGNRVAIWTCTCTRPGRPPGASAISRTWSRRPGRPERALRRSATRLQWRAPTTSTSELRTVRRAATPSPRLRPRPRRPSRSRRTPRRARSAGSRSSRAS